MSTHAPMLHAVSAAAHRGSARVSSQAPGRVGNWPDPMRSLCNVGNWPDPMGPAWPGAGS
jgi:hypothetical protein